MRANNDQRHVGVNVCFVRFTSEQAEANALNVRRRFRTPALLTIYIRASFLAAAPFYAVVRLWR